MKVGILWIVFNIVDCGMFSWWTSGRLHHYGAGGWIVHS